MRRIPHYDLYGEAPGRAPDRLVHVETIEARSAGHHWKIEPHLHRALAQLVFVLRGRGVVTAESVRAQYRPPALIVMPAGVVHGFEFEPGTSGHVVTLSDALLRELVRRDAAIAALFRRPTTLELTAPALRSTDLAQGLRRLAREFARREEGRELALLGWTEVLLANVLRLARATDEPADAASDGRRQVVARFGELIERRFREGAPLRSYAEALNVSESRLRTACLSTTGQAPIQLIHARLVLEAKRQLLYTADPVRRIAYGLGFEDPAYFTRFFTRRAGVSPRAFRQRGPERALAKR